MLDRSIIETLEERQRQEEFRLFQLRMRAAKGDPDAIREVEEEQRLLEIRVQASRAAWGFLPKKSSKGSNVVTFPSPGSRINDDRQDGRGVTPLDLEPMD